MAKKLDVEYVYAGALLHNDQVVHSYIRIVEGGLGDAVGYPKQMSKHGVGSVIKFTALDTPDNLLAGTGQFKQVWGQRKQVTEWQAMSDAVNMSEAAYEAEKAKPSPVLELLEPLRIAHAKLQKREQAILLATICAYIVGED